MTNPTPSPDQRLEALMNNERLYEGALEAQAEAEAGIPPTPREDLKRAPSPDLDALREDYRRLEAEVAALREAQADALKMLQNVEECPYEANRLFCKPCQVSLEVAQLALTHARAAPDKPF